jgi:hypothetical protein
MLGIQKYDVTWLLSLIADRNDKKLGTVARKALV